MGHNQEIDIEELMKKMNGGGFQERDYSKYDPDRNKRNTHGKKGGKSGYGKSGGKAGSGNQGAGGGYQRKYKDGYVGAPYNFVPFWKKVLVPEGELTSHASLANGTYSGEIAYSVTAQTPIHIGCGDGEGGFYRDMYGKYAIPGSTIRGLIRGNARVLGLGEYAEDVDDYALMYRAVATGEKKLRGRYNDVLGAKIMTDQGRQYSVLQNVKAGYIKKAGSSYVISPTKSGPVDRDHFGEMNYYVISERHIIESYVKSLEGGKFFYDYFLPDNGKKMQNLVIEGRRADQQFTKGTDRAGRTEYTGRQNPDYLPYYAEVSYKVNYHSIMAVGAPGKYECKGTLISTGFTRCKKAVYIIPEMDEAVSTPLKDEDVRNFQIDYEHKKNGLKDKDFYDLPKDGECKPVFYIEIGEKTYFGFTPRLRLFYDHTIKDLLPGTQKLGGKKDFVKHMFGFADKNSSYRSKLSFSDLTLEGNADVRSKTVLLQGPKPSSFSDYLTTDQNGNAYTYNDGDGKLRGIKQYWLHEETETQEIDFNKQKKLISRICTLPAGCVFSGVIRYHNLTAEELGLLLWSIRLEKNSMMNIGHAKPLGYGRISARISSVKEWDAEKAYCNEDLITSPWKDEEIDVDKMISIYQEYLKKTLDIEDIYLRDPFRTFFLMKDNTRKPNPNRIRYMKIDNREYQNRRPLPDAQNVAGNGGNGGNPT